ncbi:predicted protein [Uncinocarpus reesii 1704]|uniref:Telomere length regulation protein conserved domain-containing protein n=1 Tax=Uncinocarpus reesii (strain UAMH 1704) TaxID=336963 RepID=C4JJN0_UNCRE|nr:uncharacterized protein UREG_01837 [Uncinocarpus reesii 1704]EEP76988.1 predicted protein [Uncinocarpus reesii 1704]
MALSKLTDPPDRAMRFQLEEMQGESALWYMGLTEIRDQVGALSDLQALKRVSTRKPKAANSANLQASQSQTRLQSNSAVNQTRVISIEEISDHSEGEDDFQTYEKPDSDASDSEEDPTLIQRSKPLAPVYIRDLVSGLRDSENAERYSLAISTAPGLIRRKAAFGTEILENANELALNLVSLQDKYDISNFHERRMESLIALIVVLPSQMGRWMAHSLFNVDLSLGHRSSILVALGLAARELAGFGDEDAKALGLSPQSNLTFPSKKLPQHLESIYGSPQSSIETISNRISQNILEPLALNAADTLTGPNIMKLQPLSSNATEDRRQRELKSKRKQTTIPKEMYTTLTDSFLMPLLGEFGVMMYTMR